MKKCGNCKNRYFRCWGDLECCIDYEMTSSEAEEIKTAEDCPKYECGVPDCLQDDEYTPSATCGDYSPSNPWNAPGMSIHDFI